MKLKFIIDFWQKLDDHEDNVLFQLKQIDIGEMRFVTNDAATIERFQAAWEEARIIEVEVTIL
jgi:hypothetical protein